MTNLSCKAQVKKELDRLKISHGFIDIGVVELPDNLNLERREKLKNNLLLNGLKLHSTKKGVLFEKIKDAILQMIKYSDGHPVVCYSEYLSVRLSYDYTYLANIFSEVSGMSIHQYIILSKIERVKELILTEDFSLSEIAFRLHYSSLAHLSGQFKKVTGLSPSCYRSINLQQ